MAKLKPWHDTKTHHVARRPCGPIVPVHDGAPTSTREARTMRCAACGKTWRSKNTRTLARVWWSAGAYAGKESTAALLPEELEAGPRDLQEAAVLLEMHADTLPDMADRINARRIADRLREMATTIERCDD